MRDKWLKRESKWRDGRAKNQEAVQEIITHDPFYQNEIAQYEIIEFEASKYCPEFETIISKTFDDKSLD